MLLQWYEIKNKIKVKINNTNRPPSEINEPLNKVKPFENKNSIMLITKVYIPKKATPFLEDVIKLALHDTKLNLYQNKISLRH